jgi:flagellar motor switch protein FliN
MSETENKQDTAVEEPKKKPKANVPEGYDIDMVLDIPLTVSVEFGKVKMLVNDLLQLGQGSIVELDKAVGDPLEIHVNDKLFARGEIVVLEDRFGIRLTDIISLQDRVKSLG